MIKSNSFGKTERLTSARVIEKLFSKGRKFNTYPLRIIWKLNEEIAISEVRILITVPKKQFTRAVDRNLIKRRIREAYRKNKSILFTILSGKEPISIEIAFIYSGKEILEYNELEKKVISALQVLAGFISVPS